VDLIIVCTGLLVFQPAESLPNNLTVVANMFFIPLGIMFGAEITVAEYISKYVLDVVRVKIPSNPLYF
jgi:hypothetical protein